MSDDTPTGLSVATADGVQTLRLTRASKKNALTSVMYAGLKDALVDGDGRADVAVHMLVGSGGSFSAGSDVAEFAERARGRADLSGPILEFIRYLPRIGKPLIAAVDGLRSVSAPRCCCIAISSMPRRRRPSARRSSISAWCRRRARACWHRI